MMIDKHFEDMKLIPLFNNGKIPKVKWGNDEVLDFTGDETGYGIDTGRSNLVVIDCDNKNNVNGVNAFIELCQQNGGIPDTLIVETPNNGLHFYFKDSLNNRFKTSASTVFGDGIDVRAWGGYTVGPGSKVKDNDGLIKEYKIEDENAEIAELPQWIYDVLLKHKSSFNGGQSETIVETVGSNSHKNNKKSDVSEDSKNLSNKHALDWAVDKMTNAISGTRNETLNLTSYFMGRKRIDEAEAKKLIDIAMEKGLDVDSAMSTFNSGYKSGLNEEELEFDVIPKEYNKRTGTSFKEDPTDTEFYSHVSIAYNFWKRYNDDLIYWRGSWYGYDNEHEYWRLLDEDNIKGLVKNFFESFIPNIRSKHTRLPVNIYRLQEKMWTKNFIESVAAVAKWEFINDDDVLFDSNPYLINCKNGVFDVVQEKLLPHNKKMFLTRYIPIEYEKDFKDKYFEMIVDSVDASQKDYLQLLLGQSLLGVQPISQAIFFLHGKGSNGKSTLIDLIIKTSGTYGRLQSPDILLPSNGKEVYAMADFEGLRTVIVEELPDSKQLNSGAVKRLVGTRQINARQIYGKNKTFENISTIFVSCNRLPLVTEFDHGTWRRLAVFTFPYTYKKSKDQIRNSTDKLGDPRVIYAANHRNDTLKAGLAWRVEGAVKWYRDQQLENTSKPHSMEETENEWRENNDLLYGFLNENYIVDQSSFVLLQDLFDAFNIWLFERGNSKVSMRYFVEALQNHEFFFNNKLSYKKSTKALNSLKHSEWFNPNEPTKISREPTGRISYIVGLKNR